MDDRLFIKGFTFGWMAKRGEYRTEETIDSLRKLKETGSEWIALAFDIRQETAFSTKIYFDYRYNATDKDIEFIVDKAHEMGIKVCLKPVINCNDGLWRARINFPDDAIKYWEEWFESYEDFICHYAELAEDMKCEMFCIGCEMVGTERKVSYWRKIIAEIRKVYSGPLMYNTNHGDEEAVEWFDAVDVIGTSAYYSVGNVAGDREENMINNWHKVKKDLQRVYEKFNKPIVFAEIGCRSAYGCATMPWDFVHRELPFNEEEQANFYSSVMKVFWNEPWFGGFFWWDWSHKLHDINDAKANVDFGIYGKKAEKIIKEWYL